MASMVARKSFGATTAIDAKAIVGTVAFTDTLVIIASHLLACPSWSVVDFDYLKKSLTHTTDRLLSFQRSGHAGLDKVTPDWPERKMPESGLVRSLNFGSAIGVHRSVRSDSIYPSINLFAY